jgi:hypothetical protein
MKPLREWTLGRVLLACAGWVVLSLALIAFWIFAQIASTADIGSGSAAVRFEISELLLAIPVGPPIILFLAWLIARVRR